MMDSVVTSGHILLSNRLAGRIRRAEKVDIKDGAEASVFGANILPYCLLLLVLSSGAAGGGCWTLFVL